MYPISSGAMRRGWCCVGLGVLLLACGGDSAGPSQPTDVLVTAGTTVLNAVGASTQLAARVVNGKGKPIAGASITWSTGNADVLQVSPSGLVTAVRGGKATVTASSPPANGSIEITVEQVPTGLDVVDGVGQAGEVGLPLAQPIRFRVNDANGHTVAGKTVQLAVTRGGGSAAAGSAVTAADGTAQVLWTLGTNASEPQELTATIGAFSRVVTATPRPGAPIAVEIAGGADQTGLAGEPLADSLAARVVDRYKNPVPGATVTWSVTQGGGNIAPLQTTTGPDGRARTRWLLGPNAGAHESAGTSAGMPAVTFRATALPNGAIEGTISSSAALLSQKLRGGDISIFSGAAERKPWARASGVLLAVEPGLPDLQVGPRSAGRVDTVPGQWLVRVRDDALSVPARLAAFSVVNARVVDDEMRAQLAGVAPVAQRRIAIEGISPVLGIARVRVAAGVNSSDVVAELRRDPHVQSVEPLIFYRSVLGPETASSSSLIEERYFPRQSWHYGAVGVPRAWEITEGSPAVIVAVVDDGIRFDHISVAPNLTTDGYDFVSDITIPGCTGGSISNAGDGDGPDSDPTIPASYSMHSSQPCVASSNTSGGHGLHVAGTIAAAAASGGIVGVAPRVRIRPIRVLGTTGSGTNYDIAQGILYAAGLAADDGAGGIVMAPSRAPIINLSLGGSTSSPVLADAVLRASEAGSLLIAAAGNSGSSSPHYPAAYPQTLSVSALGPNHGLAPYSNWGATIDLAAPGGDLSLGSTAGVWSARWDFQNGTPVLAPLHGTSMAAPHVAGVAALLLSQRPTLSAADLRQALIATAIDLGAAGKDAHYGHGLVNAYAALTDGQGLPSILRVHLFNAASGAQVASMPAGSNRSFRFSGLADGNYYIYAGGDDRGDGITGRPGFLWGARGGTPTPAAVNITGHGTRNGSFTIGLPTEFEPNGSWQIANTLVIGGYAYGAIGINGDHDYFRFQVAQTRTLTFETGGWYGGCGFGYEVDTVLDLLSPAGAMIATNDDIDYSRDRLCSRISITLNAGTYYLRVRGLGTGTYTVRVW